MHIHFKGTRGSIPTAPNASDVSEKVVSARLLGARGKDLRSESQIREFVKKVLPFSPGIHFRRQYSVRTVDTGSNDWLIFDGGSGLRVLGNEIMANGLSNQTFHLFMSHFHYDHIQGIPFFFTPAYIPGK